MLTIWAQNNISYNSFGLVVRTRPCAANYWRSVMEMNMFQCILRDVQMVPFSLETSFLVRFLVSYARKDAIHIDFIGVWRGGGEN